MHVVQVRTCAKPVHDLADFAFGLCNDREPHIVFMRANVIVRDGRDFVDRGGELVNVGNLARTEARNKAERLGIVHSADATDNTRLAEAFDRLENLLFRDGAILCAELVCKHLVGALIQRESVLNNR